MPDRPPVLSRPQVLPAAIIAIMLYIPVLFYTTILSRRLRAHAEPIRAGIAGRLDDPSFWIVLGVLGAGIVTVIARRRAFLTASGTGIDYISLALALRCSARAWRRLVWLPIVQCVALLGYTLFAKEQIGAWLRPNVNQTWALLQTCEGVFNLAAIWLAFLCLIYIRTSLHYIAYAEHSRTYPGTPRDARVARNWLKHAPWIAATIILSLGLLWTETLGKHVAPLLPPPDPIIGTPLEAVLLFVTFFVYSLSFIICGLWHLNETPQVRRDICQACGYSLAGTPLRAGSRLCSECGMAN